MHVSLIAVMIKDANSIITHSMLINKVYFSPSSLIDPTTIRATVWDLNKYWRHITKLVLAVPYKKNNNNTAGAFPSFK